MEKVGCDAGKRQIAVFRTVVLQKNEIVVDADVAGKGQSVEIVLESPAVLRGQGFLAHPLAQLPEIIRAGVLDPIKTGLAVVQLVSDGLPPKIDPHLGRVH